MKNSSLNFNFKSLIDWKGLLLLVFILSITFFKCSNNENKGELIKIDKNYYKVIKKSTDSAYKKNKIVEYRSTKEIYTIITEFDTLIQLKDIDTSSILKDYFTKIISIDTLKLKDSLGYVAVTDTITKNRILSRKYFAEINQLEIHDTTWLSEPKRDKMYVGVSAGMVRNQLPATLGVNLLYQTKHDKLYGVGVGLQNMNGVSPYINASMYWKLKLKK
jgi:hypothetical protein